MNILVTNDDGHDAPGIAALREAMEGLGQIMIAAPDKNHSGASSSLTLSRPIAVHEVARGHYRIAGTPSDCVHLALTGDFLPARPDLVVSGVNDGANMGDDTIYSGTVAAAIEGHLFDVPGFAFSMAGRPARHFEAGAAAARHLALRFRQNRPPMTPLLNVNIPDAPRDSVGEDDFAITRLGRRHPAQAAIRQPDAADGARVFVVGEAGSAMDDAPGTDFHAVASGKISVTPLMVDLTNAPQIGRVEEWLRG